MAFDAKTVFVANQNNKQVSLRFVAAGSNTKMGEQNVVLLDWHAARTLIDQIKESDPELLGHARPNLAPSP
jgi:hypothetical protein